MKQKKREWVKNAVIALLAVLLILTFFSNTIMNYSLPEVAAQYPQSGTITTRIRGSGVVEAAQTYNVTVQETRTVGSVQVKVGDQVAPGDTLLILDETESQELTEARNTLAALQLEYDKMQVSKGDQTHAAWTAWQQARDAVTKAQADLAEARDYEASRSAYESQVTAAQNALAARTREKQDADSLVTSLTNQLAAVESSNEEYLSAKERAANYPEDEEAKAEVQRIYDQQIAPAIASLNQQLLAAQQNADAAAAAVTGAQSYLDSVNSAFSRFQTDHAGVMSVDAAQAALDAAQAALDTLEAANYDAMAQQQYDDALAQIDKDAKEKELRDAEERVRTLEEKTGAAKVVSRYPGTVQTINIAAGDKTTPDTTLMVVELTERGYTLTATVTKEQARGLREGMPAEVTNLYQGGVTMILTGIATDKTNPAASRTLTFAVQGEDVVVGQQLSFSIGDKNAGYDVVVPSAAVHTDADGSFVYTVAVKQSPLGNRYSVKRTDVEVIASDDTRSAVTGTLTTADFVITTATVPLSPGDQVRIAE